MYPDAEEFNANEMWKQKWWLADKECTSFVRSGDGFSADATIGFADMVAFSGWDFTKQALRRFPIVAADGDYLQIVYDVRRDLRAWLARSEFQQLPELPIARLMETFFDGRTIERCGIDVFGLLGGEYGSKGRRVYAKPESGAAVRIVHATTDELPHGNATIVECRNGYAKIMFINPCGDQPESVLGWVRVRDCRGRLTIWCWTGLSC
jgi:hypothetical protein